MNFAAKVSFPFAFMLAFIGGFADAGSFVNLGVFSAHITGNTVLTFVYMANGSWHELAQTLTALALFVSGTASGIYWRRKFDLSTEKRQLSPLFIELGLMSCSIILMKVLPAELGQYLFLAGLSYALGFQNGVYCKLYGVGVHTTYITGQSTVALEDIISLCGPKGDMAAKRNIHLGLIFSFILGACAGAFVNTAFGFDGFLALPLLLCGVIFFKAKHALQNSKKYFAK